MKAVIFRKHGDPSALEYSEITTPKPGAGEVLIRVKACALNHLDIWTRQGIPGVAISMPHVSGCDVAGEIAELGRGVKNLKVGSRAVVAPGISCGKCSYCKTGWDSLCPDFKILGFQVDGGYAEYCVVPARNVMPATSKYSWVEWASMPLVFLTAWHMLVTRAQLKKGETVLIHAAGSGVGIAAIQIAKLLGARVITTVGNSQKEAAAKKMGADSVINYKLHDFPEEVKKSTKHHGVDVVFEHIGAETFTKSLTCLAKKGRLVTCGVTSGGQAIIDLRFLYIRQHTILGSYMGGRVEMDQVMKFIRTGRLKPVVDAVLPLAQARQAQERMLERKNFGKIVLEV